jgi:hypothetical protein
MKKENAKKLYLDAIANCEKGIEIWTDCYHEDKKIKGYQVSNFGNVRSFWKKTPKIKDGKFAGSIYTLCEYPKLLKGKLSKKGYRAFDFGRKIINVGANRLVMDSFCPLKYICPKYISEDIWDSTDCGVKELVASGLIVDHKDHVKHNNKIVNLEYITQKENARRAQKFYGGNASLKKKVEKRKRFAVYDSNKKMFRGIDLTRFCKEHKLDRRSMQKVIKGDVKNYKGWTRAEDCYYNV